MRHKLAIWFGLFLLGWMYTASSGAAASVQLSNLLGGVPAQVEIAVADTFTHPDTPIQLGPGDPTTPPTSLCGTGDESVTQAAATFLPNQRWGGVQMLHTRQDPGFLGLNLIQTGVAVGLFGIFYGLGNVFYTIGSSLTQEANRMCVADQAATITDKAASVIGHALQDNKLVYGAVLAGLVIALVAAARGGTWKSMLRVALCFLFLMTTVWRADTALTKPVGETVGAPSWYGVNIMRAVAGVATAPAAAINQITPTIANTGVSDGSSCQAYIGVLYQLYKNQWTSDGFNTAGAQVPLTLSNMWVTSAGTIFQEAQFGKNSVGVDVWCRAMEMRVRAAPYMQYQITRIAMGLAPMADLTKVLNVDKQKAQDAYLAYLTCGPATMPGWGACFLSKMGDDPIAKQCANLWGDSVAVYLCYQQHSGVSVGSGYPYTTMWLGAMFNGNAVAEDIALVAWGSCQYIDGKWAPRPGWVGHDYNPVTVEDCANAFGADADINNNNSLSDFLGTMFFGLDTKFSVFNFDLSDKQVKKDVAGKAPIDQWSYLNTLQGYQLWPAVGASFVFVLSAAVVGGVFTIISGAQIVAQLALWALLAMMVVAAAIAIIHPRGEQVLANLGKTIAGFSLYAFGASLLLALIGLTTAVAILVLTPLLSIPVLGIALVGAAPIIGVVCVNMLFTKVLKTPSPLSVKGALAWGGVFAGGAAVGALAQGGIMSRALRGMGQLRMATGRTMRGMRFGSQGRLGGRPGSGVAGEGRSNGLRPLRSLPGDHPSSVENLRGGARRLQEARNRAEARQWALGRRREAAGLPAGDTRSGWALRRAEWAARADRQTQHVRELRDARAARAIARGKAPSSGIWQGDSVSRMSRWTVGLQDRVEAFNEDTAAGRAKMIAGTAGKAGLGVVGAATAVGLATAAPALAVGAVAYGSVKAVKKIREARADHRGDYERWVADQTDKHEKAKQQQQIDQQAAAKERAYERARQDRIAAEKAQRDAAQDAQAAAEAEQGTPASQPPGSGPANK